MSCTAPQHLAVLQLHCSQVACSHLVGVGFLDDLDQGPHILKSARHHAIQMAGCRSSSLGGAVMWHRCNTSRCHTVHWCGRHALAVETSALCPQDATTRRHASPAHVAQRGAVGAGGQADLLGLAIHHAAGPKAKG